MAVFFINCCVYINVLAFRYSCRRCIRRQFQLFFRRCSANSCKGRVIQRRIRQARNFAIAAIIDEDAASLNRLTVDNSVAVAVSCKGYAVRSNCYGRVVAHLRTVIDSYRRRAVLFYNQLVVDVQQRIAVFRHSVQENRAVAQGDIVLQGYFIIRMAVFFIYCFRYVDVLAFRYGRRRSSCCLLQLAFRCGSVRYDIISLPCSIVLPCCIGQARNRVLTIFTINQHITGSNLLTLNNRRCSSGYAVFTVAERRAILCNLDGVVPSCAIIYIQG